MKNSTRGEALLREPPERNCNCRHYEECLSNAARKNRLDLGCGTCHLRDDYAYEMSQLDAVGLLSLWSEITYEKIFDTWQLNRTQ